ncbi:MAG: flagellar hook-associated protein FlgL [Bdellovibrionota bacterium]
MRIADKMQYNQVTSNIQKNREGMSELQNQAATQKRVTKPSDDPLASTRVLSARTEERGNNQFVKNINQAKSFLEFSDQSLNELSDILVRAKELAVGQSSDGASNEESRRITALEVEQIHSQALQVGNRKLGERFIFGGFQTQKSPFDSNGEYLGDDGEMRVQTEKEGFLAMNVPGSKVFLGKNLGNDGVIRDRSASPRTVEDLNLLRSDRERIEQEKALKDEDYVQTRGPSSFGRANRLASEDPSTQDLGINVFQTLKGLEIALRTNDKAGIQDSLDYLDQSINQVIHARAELGARVSTLNANVDSLQKATVDQKILASQLEDADLFQLVSDINKSDSALKATLETSGKIVQSSLLDFLR